MKQTLLSLVLFTPFLVLASSLNGQGVREANEPSVVTRTHEDKGPAPALPPREGIEPHREAPAVPERGEPSEPSKLEPRHDEPIPERTEPGEPVREPEKRPASTVPGEEPSTEPGERESGISEPEKRPEVPVQEPSTASKPDVQAFTAALNDRSDAFIKDNPFLANSDVGRATSDILATFSVLAQNTENASLTAAAINSLPRQFTLITRMIATIDPSSFINDEEVANLATQRDALSTLLNRAHVYRDQLDSLSRLIEGEREKYDNVDSLLNTIKSIQARYNSLITTAATKMDQMSSQLSKSFITRVLNKLLTGIRSFFVQLGFTSSPSTLTEPPPVPKDSAFDVASKTRQTMQVIEDNEDAVQNQLENIEDSIEAPDGPVVQDEKTARLQALAAGAEVVPSLTQFMQQAKDSIALARQKMNTDADIINFRAANARAKALADAKADISTDILQIFNLPVDRIQNPARAEGTTKDQHAKNVEAAKSTGVNAQDNIYLMLEIPVGSSATNVTNAIDKHISELTGGKYNLKTLLDQQAVILPQKLQNVISLAELASIKNRVKLFDSQTSRDDFNSQAADIINGYVALARRMSNPTYKSIYDALVRGSGWQSLPARQQFSSTEDTNLRDIVTTITESGTQYNASAYNLNRLETVRAKLPLARNQWNAARVTT